MHDVDLIVIDRHRQRCVLHAMCNAIHVSQCDTLFEKGNDVREREKESERDRRHYDATSIYPTHIVIVPVEVGNKLFLESILYTQILPPSQSTLTQHSLESTQITNKSTTVH